MTIISALAGWIALASCAYAQPSVQNSQIVTPNFVPAGNRPSTDVTPASYLTPVVYPQEGKNGVGPRVEDEGGDYSVRTELPGPQRLFMRESEEKFYDRIRQIRRKNPAIFPEEVPLSKESYTQPSYPRIDPLFKAPFPHMVGVVEPSYVCHRRLLFEQPNFERTGYNLGMVQPAIQLGVFYYDILMLPYHYSTDLRVRGECSVGKCLPGDQAPLTVPIERFSVTGVIGEAAAIIGGAYLFPH